MNFSSFVISFTGSFSSSEGLTSLDSSFSLDIIFSCFSSSTFSGSFSLGLTSSVISFSLLISFSYTFSSSEG